MENSSTADPLIYSEKDPKFIGRKIVSTCSQWLKKNVLFVFVLVSAVLIYIFFIKDSYYLFQLTRQKEISQLQNEIIEMGGYHDFGIGMVGFRGQIKEIGKDYLILNGGDDTVRVTLKPDASFAEFPWIVQGNMADRMHKIPERKIKFESLRKDEFVDVIGVLDNNNLDASKIVVYRKWIN